MNMNMNMNNRPIHSSKTSQPPRLTAILGSFLEVIVHEIIYTRTLYPRDAFSPTRHYGVACHACRHPDVVNYIFETLQVAVPGIVSGVIDGMHLVIYDTATDELMERYSMEFQLDETFQAIIQFSSAAHSEGHDTKEGREIEQKMQELERSLRDMLLKVVSLEGTNLGSSTRGKAGFTFTDSTTFKLCLHSAKASEEESSPPSASNSSRNCLELDEAMKEGKWFRADSLSCSFGDSSTPTMMDVDGTKSLTRPLKSINVHSCGLKAQLFMEFPK